LLSEDAVSIKPIDNRKDFLLLLLYSPGKRGERNEPISGRTRLVKMLFVFRQEALPLFKKNTKVDERNFYQFFPWNFGPFSSDVYDDINFFLLRGFIKAKGSDEELLHEAAEELSRWASEFDTASSESEIEEFEEEVFSLTEKGAAFAEALYADLSDSQKSLLKEFKSKFSNTPLRAILRYVYSQYPDSTSKSQIKDKVLGSGLASH